MILAVTGCQNKEETPADKQGVTEGIKEIFGDYIIEPNDALIASANLSVGSSQSVEFMQSKYNS